VSTQHAHTGERHHPVIEDIRERIIRSYVTMLSGLNADIAVELKNARGLRKGIELFVIQGGFESDLFKANSGNFHDRHYKDNPKYRWDETKKRYVSVIKKEETKKRAPKKEDEKKPRAKGAGKKVKKPAEVPLEERPSFWFADEFGNVRQAFEATGRYTRQLTPEEIVELYKNLNVVIGQVIGANAANLADFMGIDIDVINTLQDAVSYAQSTGRSAEDQFVEDFINGVGREYLDEPADHNTKVDKAHEVYSEMMNAFKEAVEDDYWKKRVEKLLIRRKNEEREAAIQAKKQQALIGNFFDKAMTGDAKIEGAKMLGVMHDLGMFFIPKNQKDAMAYAEDEAEAKNLRYKILINTDRYNALLASVSAMSIEQQLAWRITALVGAEKDALKTDPSYSVESFWNNKSDEAFASFDLLRKWQKDAGREFTDDEWNLVRDRAFEMARSIASMMTSYNLDKRSVVVMHALAHDITNLERLFKNPEELEKLQKDQDDHDAKIARALDAQTRTDAFIDPAIDAFLKKKDPNGGLFSHQKSAVGWMQEIKSGLLAYGTGTGKTPIAVSFISTLMKLGKAKRGIIVAPGPLVNQWASEIARFRPGSKVETLTGNITEDRLLMLEAFNRGETDADFIVMPESTLDITQASKDKLAAIIERQKKANPDVKIGPVQEAKILHDSGILADDLMVKALRELEGAAIFDEVHLSGFKGSENNRHQVAREMLKGREYKFGMSATPMSKDMEDLYNLMDMFHPGSAGDSLDEFMSRFAGFTSVIDPETGEKHMEIAKEDLPKLQAAKATIAPYVYFRSKLEHSIISEMEARGKRLPDVNPVTFSVKLSDEAQKEYDACGGIGYDEIVEPYGGKGKDYITDNQFIEERVNKGWERASAESACRSRVTTRKLMAAVSPKLVNKDYTGPQEKIDAVTELVQRHFHDSENKNKPIVIFCNYINALQLSEDALAEAGFPRHLIKQYHGGTSMNDRAAIQDAVNAGKVKVLLIGTAAGGAGLNLQGYKDPETGKSVGPNRLVFLDKPWTPAQIEQAVGRVWRTGSPYDRVHIHHFHTYGTTDDRKMSKNIDRLSTWDALSVADQGEAAISSKIMESLMRLMGEIDTDQTSWTPEQRKELCRKAGLSDTDFLPKFAEMETLKEEVDFEKVKAAVDMDRFKRSGDVVIGHRNTINEIRHKRGTIDDKKYQRERRAIAKDARDWMAVVDKSQHQYVAKYVQDFDWKDGEESTTMGNQSKGIKPKGKKSNKVPKGAEVIHLDSLKASKKITPDSGINFKVTKNPYPKANFQYYIWEAMRRTRPASYKDAVKNIAGWIYEEYKDDAEPYSKKEAMTITMKWLEKKKVLEEFRKKGLIEVA